MIACTLEMDDCGVGIAVTEWIVPWVLQELNYQIIFDDPLILAAGLNSPWSRRRRIELAELTHERWIIPAHDTWTYARLAEAFQQRGLSIPKASLVTIAWPLVAHFLANGSFITGCARSIARLSSLKELSVDFPVKPWPVLMVTLKNRTLSPAVERFMEAASTIGKSLASKR